MPPNGCAPAGGTPGSHPAGGQRRPDPQPAGGHRSGQPGGGDADGHPPGPLAGTGCGLLCVVQRPRLGRLALTQPASEQADRAHHLAGAFLDLGDAHPGVAG